MTRPILVSLLLLGCTRTQSVQPAATATPASAPEDVDGHGSSMDPKDACPEGPGSQPDGCPAKGGDSILDADDRCPAEPESRNGYQDDDGCPDEIPEDLAGVTGVLEGVTFELDKDIVKPSSFPRLDQVVQVLARYPEVRIEISGHSDRADAPSYGLDLPKRRASAIERYLIDQGIDQARLEHRGFGTTRPIDSDKTAKGRARNRRIELTILVR